MYETRNRWAARWVWLLAAAGFASACAPRLSFDDEEGAGTAEVSSASTDNAGGIPARSGAFQHRLTADGSIETTADATDYDAFQYLDLDTGEARQDGWDLAFRRFLIKTNSGESGDGGVALVRLPGVPFEAVTEAPEDDADWLVDEPDGPDDTDTLADSPFNDGVNDWYDYELADHSLTPRDFSYVIRSTEGRFYRLRITGYYDDAGTSGVVSFRWAELAGADGEAPPPAMVVAAGGAAGAGPGPSSGSTTEESPATAGAPGNAEGGADAGEGSSDGSRFVVDASGYDAFIHLSITDGLVEVPDPSSSQAWDLAIRRYVIRTNGGTSGPGQAGVQHDGLNRPFAEVEAPGSGDFIFDEVLPATDAPGSLEVSASPVLADWYDYGGFGQLSPKELTWIVRGASGDLGKLRIHSYQGGIYELSLAPLALPADSQ